jgi:hypothetical protein
MRAFLALVAAVLLSGGLLVAVGVHGQLLNLTHSSKTAEQSFGNGSPSQPWPSTSTINAINYDIGGSGIGYISPVTGCLNSSSYRPDTVNFKTSTAGAPYVLGCSTPGIAYKYTINITGTGPFTITANLADTSAGGSWGVSMDGTSIGSIATPNTASFTTFQGGTLSAPFNATAGNHTLQFTSLGGDALFNGSGDFLSFQVSQATGGGGIACNIGPNYTGTIPAGAVAAGFTHCAANFDFGQAQFSNPANWLDCAGASTPIFFFNNQSGSAPCGSAVSVVTDSSGGGQKALDMHWDPSWQPFSEIDPEQLFPEGVYIDWIMRYSSSYLTANSLETLIGSIYSESGNCCTVNAYEWDLDEQAIKPSQPSLTFGYTATHPVQWPLLIVPNGVPVAFNTISNFNPTIYQNYGVRITTDGNIAWSMCNYWNGQFESCDNWNAPWQIAAADQLNRWKIQVGPLSSTLNNGTAYDAFWQRVTFWTCPAWSPSSQLTQCNNNPTKSGAP